MTKYVLELLSDEITIEQVLEHLQVQETSGSQSNKIIIRGGIFKSCQIKIIFTGSNGTLYLGDDCNYRGSIRIDTNASVSIGNKFRGTNNISLLCRPGKNITIGDNCLFASGIVIRTSDEHSIFSLETNLLLNPNKNVRVENNVWICDNVTILKGSYIRSGSVIGAGSIVSGEIPEHVVAAGNPIKVLKKNIRWSHDKPL